MRAPLLVIARSDAAKQSQEIATRLPCRVSFATQQDLLSAGEVGLHGVSNDTKGESFRKTITRHKGVI